MTSTAALPKAESILEKLGPGLITGAADDDPSGIAAYSQGGAQFGYKPSLDAVLHFGTAQPRVCCSGASI